MRWFDKILAIFIIIALGVSAYFLFIKNTKNNTVTSQSTTTSTTPTVTQTPRNNAEASIKETVALKVPFTAQAPTANWDSLHNEACEEASAIMANAYFSGITTPTLAARDVENEITHLTEWQDDHQGYHLDQTTVEVANMINAVYTMNAQVSSSFTEKDLKQALSDGKLILLSANGQLLDNPNFKQPGPIHHMIVITGYDQEGFITNDPGTRKGQNYRYSYTTLHTAAADWVHSEKSTNTSKKPIIIISKPQ